MDASVWTVPITVIVLSVLLALSRRFLGARLARSAEAPLSEDERRIYQRWNVGMSMMFLVILPVLSYVWNLAIRRAAGRFSRPTAATRYLVEPTWLC
jgi:hypothetical protein